MTGFWLGVLFLSLFVFLLLRIPIFISLCLSSFIVILAVGNIPEAMVAQRLFGGIDKFALMAMPFYIYAADLMIVGGIAQRLLKFTGSLLGFIPGAAALTTEFASMLFGALSGSSPATVAAIGGLMYPEMKRQKYDEGFSVGLLASSGAVAILIPPSITFIVYGAVSGVSIGALFISGIGAGLVFGGLICAYVVYYAKKNNIKSEAKFSLKEVGRTGKEAFWSLGVPVIIIGGMYTGFFTATEAAGVSAIYAIIIGMFVYKEMSLESLYKTTVNSAATISSVMVVVAAAAIFGWVLTIYQVPQLLAEALLTPFMTPTVFLIIINIIFLIAGMFMDGSAAVTIVIPIILPIALKLGINPVHLGAISVANFAIGMYTPPFGLNLFVANKISGVGIEKIVKGTLPFIAVTLVALVLITYIPQISLALPSLVYPDILK
ncbi:MAG: TRAP transporter large permease [Thermincola sp.]|jgi:C4-dicarboxylate transporter DctM subunit|nr:TRAP transporter large permease [Thermincola sp.]MDT3704222.1 TRAP transporter large permease [Thermincola sp.]